MDGDSEEITSEGDPGDLIRSLHPRLTPVELFNQVAKTYDTIYTGPAIDAEDRLIWKLARKTIGDQGRVLDWGCGTGWLLKGCPVDPVDYLGVDPAEGMLQVARKKYPAHDFATELTDEDKKRGFQSIISVWGPLSYDPWAERTVADLIPSLSPGGQVLLTVYGPTHDSRRTPAVELDPTLHRNFTAQEAYSLVSDHLERVKIWGLGWGEPNPSLSPRMLDRLLARERRTLGKWYPDDCFAMVIQGRKPR